MNPSPQECVTAGRRWGGTESSGLDPSSTDEIDWARGVMSIAAPLDPAHRMQLYHAVKLRKTVISSMHGVQSIELLLLPGSAHLPTLRHNANLLFLIGSNAVPCSISTAYTLVCLIRPMQLHGRTCPTILISARYSSGISMCFHPPPFHWPRQMTNAAQTTPKVSVAWVGQVVGANRATVLLFTC